MNKSTIDIQTYQPHGRLFNFEESCKVAEKKKKRIIKKSESVRERAAKKAEDSGKTTKARRVVRSASKPLSGASKAGRKEFHPIKLPDNKLGALLGKRVRFVPKYFRNAWQEIKLVEWPTARETSKLTFAVIVFALAFGLIVYVVDKGLDKVFRELLLG